MQHEKIFKREDGTQIKVRVSVTTGSFDNQAYWYYGADWKEKRQRVWRHDKINLIVTPEEIYQTKLELWEKLKPVL